MLKTICLYGFPPPPPHIRSDIIFSVLKGGDNRKLSSGRASQFKSGCSIASIT